MEFRGKKYCRRAESTILHVVLNGSQSRVPQYHIADRAGRINRQNHEERRSHRSLTSNTSRTKGDRLRDDLPSRAPFLTTVTDTPTLHRRRGRQNGLLIHYSRWRHTFRIRNCRDCLFEFGRERSGSNWCRRRFFDVRAGEVPEPGAPLCTGTEWFQVEWQRQAGDPWGFGSVKNICRSSRASAR